MKKGKLQSSKIKTIKHADPIHMNHCNLKKIKKWAIFSMGGERLKEQNGCRKLLKNTF